jgi:nitrogen regulatory protein PII
MKRIELIVEPQKVHDVRDALKAIGINEVTTDEVRGKLEVVVSAERASEVIRAFAGSAWKSMIGEGKIFVYEVADPARSRIVTGQHEP